MPGEAADLAAVTARIRRRLIPFLFLLYIVAYIDRINVGFAALQMNQALGFSATTYGFGAGVFFLGYVLFEIPSNVILARVGARVWIARIMITWGVISSSTMFVRSAAGFYAVRFLLGVAEAGFFPGIIFYLTRWVPARERAQTIAAFMTATVLAGVVGAPVSGALLSLGGVGGLAGWQWLFLLEGLPAVVLGVVVLAYLVERPEEASWLNDEERRSLIAALTLDAAATKARTPSVAEALRSGRLWLLAAVYFTIPIGTYGIGFWLPQIIRTASAGSDVEIGLLSAIPYLAGAIGMVVVARHSDRTAERRWHVAIGALVGGIGVALGASVHGLIASLAALSMAFVGLNAMLGPFWTLATPFAGGAGAAAGIALINSIGNTGGFVGPYVLGYAHDATGSFAAGLMLIGAIVVCGGVLVLMVPHERV